MTIDDMPTAEERHAGQRLGLAHADAARHRHVHRGFGEEPVDLQAHEVVLEVVGTVLGVLGASQHLALHRRVDDGLDLQPSQIGLGHVQRDVLAR